MTTTYENTELSYDRDPFEGWTAEEVFNYKLHQLRVLVEEVEASVVKLMNQPVLPPPPPPRDPAESFFLAVGKTSCGLVFVGLMIGLIWLIVG